MPLCFGVRGRPRGGAHGPPGEKGPSMSRSKSARVKSRDGLLGTIEPTGGDDRAGAEHPLVRLDDGRRIRVPAASLVVQQDGSYLLTLGREEIEARAEAEGAEEFVVPVVHEVLDVQKRLVESGRVRVTKVVHQHEEVVDEPLLREEVEVERVAINRAIDGSVAVRHEGDVMIVPILEEVLVVEKRLMLKEELHIRRRQVKESQSERIVLRTEEATVERLKDESR
jgi:uncharacterized protein (TIGR02271 family)